MSSESRDETTMGLLRSVRAFGDSHDRMSVGMKQDMGMNITDVATLRLLIMREEAGQAVTPVQIARHLGISTASTTKLLDRLEASGHLERHQHPTDRRGRVIVLTEAARAEFFEKFGESLQRMRSAAADFTPKELDAATRVLDAMSAAIEPSDDQ